MPRPSALFCVALLCVGAWRANAQRRPPGDSVPRQAFADAWFTGPVAAASAATLPKGHVYAEPYLFDVISDGSHSVGSRTYLVYGLLDRLSVGLIPTFGYNKPTGGPASASVGVGDITLTSQFRITDTHRSGWMPTSSVILQATLPTGRYDQLDGRPSDGVGGGAYSTTVGLFSQWYSRLPTSRILRTRMDMSWTASREAHVNGVSVYGTRTGFIGTVTPGSSLMLNPAAEYSVTKRVVLACDLLYVWNGKTRVTAQYDAGATGTGANAISTEVGNVTNVGVIPAVEYNWSSAVGLIAGARLILPAGGATTSFTPVIALSMFR